MKKKKYHLSGSYTIEASFIFPMIMVVIVSIIYLLFFVHDRCVITAAADTAALRELAIPFHDIRLPMEVAGYAKRTDPVAFIRECRIIEEKTGKE